MLLGIVWNGENVDKKIWQKTAEQSAGGVYAHVEVGMNDWVCTQHEPDLTKYESCLKSS